MKNILLLLTLLSLSGINAYAQEDGFDSFSDAELESLNLEAEDLEHMKSMDLSEMDEVLIESDQEALDLDSRKEDFQMAKDDEINDQLNISQSAPEKETSLEQNLEQPGQIERRSFGGSTAVNGSAPLFD